MAIRRPRRGEREPLLIAAAWTPACAEEQLSQPARRRPPSDGRAGAGRIKGRRNGRLLSAAFNWVIILVMATPQEERNTGIWLIGAGLFAAALGIVLILVGWNAEHRNLILVVGASFFLLLPVYLIGIGIKKIVAAQGST
jgi:hypothetical protein